MVGLTDLRGLFQPERFSDSKSIHDLASWSLYWYPQSKLRGALPRCSGNLTLQAAFSALLTLTLITLV